MELDSNCQTPQSFEGDHLLCGFFCAFNPAAPCLNPDSTQHFFWWRIFYSISRKVQNLRSSLRWLRPSLPVGWCSHRTRPFGGWLRRWHRSCESQSFFRSSRRRRRSWAGSKRDPLQRWFGCSRSTCEGCTNPRTLQRRSAWLPDKVSRDWFSNRKS